MYHSHEDKGILLTSMLAPYGSNRKHRFWHGLSIVAKNPGSKNYRKPLLQRYVIRILLM